MISLPVGWRLLIKRDAKGNVIKYKARGFLKGYGMEHKAHYDETAAPTPRSATMRMVIAQAVEHGMKLRAADVKNAFLQTKMDRENLYMEMFSYASELVPEHVKPGGPVCED